jgi:multiple antibiotic resistance protein
MGDRGSAPEATKRRVVRKMLVTAAVAAVVLLVLGRLLTRLLHFSAGALGVSSGIILLIIAITMVLGGSGEQAGKLNGQDPMRLAVFPLAVRYLLNPSGIVVLVTASAEAGTLGVYGVVLGALAVVIVLDAVVFRLAAEAAAE